MTIAAARTSETETRHRAGIPEGTRTEPNRRVAENRSDDEILGLLDEPRQKETDIADGLSEDRDEEQFSTVNGDSRDATKGLPEELNKNRETEALTDILDSKPELRQAWEDAHEYREVFATPEEARRATELIKDLNRLDALFFSPRIEDQAELAKTIAALDPRAFASFAKAINAELGKRGHTDNDDLKRPDASDQARRGDAGPSETAQREENNRQPGSSAREEFFQSTNAAVVQGVVDQIQTQVERLLPEGASKTTRNRVVGEIYRELDRTLGENRQLAQQVRDALRAGTLDGSHQRAIVSLITGRARQALPNVAKKVMEEWTSTIVAADRGRRAKQHAAEQRVDIVGSGGAARDGRGGKTPRDIDYSRLSDSDILNL